MDPLAVVLSALSLAGQALQPLTDQPIKDGYSAFKALLIRKFAPSQPRLPQAIDDHAQDPEAGEGAVKTFLQRAGADRDQEVLDAATALLMEAEASQPGVTGGLVGQINAQGGRVVVIGGANTGTINVNN